MSRRVHDNQNLGFNHREQDRRIKALLQRLDRENPVTVRWVEPEKPKRSDKHRRKPGVRISRPSFGPGDCAFCGKSFERVTAKHRFCSRACRDEQRRSPAEQEE